MGLNESSLRVRLAITMGGALMCCSVMAAYGQDEGSRFGPAGVDPALILGRIIEKNLDHEDAAPSPILWARIPGRGVLYLMRVNLPQFETAVPGETEGTSEADRAWDNARRALLGQPGVTVDDASRAKRAIHTVQKALGDYADRLDTTARVVLHGHQVGIGVGVPWMVGTQYPSSRRGDDALSVGRIDEAIALYVDETGGSVHAGLNAPADIHRQEVILGATKILPESRGLLREQSRVLARLFEQKLRAAFPKEFWGVDRQGRAGAMTVVVSDWGPVLIFNMTFPIDAEAQVTPTKDDEWSAAAAELIGKSYSSDRPTIKKADATRLMDVLRSTLAGFGGRLTELSDDQAVTVLVFGDRRRARRSPESALLNVIPGAASHYRGYGQALRSLQRRGASVYSYRSAGRVRPEAASYVLQVSGADLAAARAGGLDQAALLESIRVSGPDREPSVR